MSCPEGRPFVVSFQSVDLRYLHSSADMRAVQQPNTGNLCDNYHGKTVPTSRSTSAQFTVSNVMMYGVPQVSEVAGTHG